VKQAFPYARVLAEIEKGTVVGGYNVTRQTSSEEQFLFGQQVLLTAAASFYFQENIADIPDGTRMGLIINMLKLGRIDSAIMFDKVASHTLNSMTLDQNAIKKDPLNHTSDIYVAFSRSQEYAQFFADKLDEGLLLLKENGQYSKLLQHYINSAKQYSKI
jgi:polar amino acid transport system substrate-binding protein